MWVKCISRLYLSSIQPTTGDKISWDYFSWSAPLKICKLQRGNIAFLPPRCTVVLLFELPVKKHLRPQLWMEGRIVDCFVLQIYLSWGQCLNNFVTNWRLIQKLLCFLFFLFVGRKKILVQCEGRLPSTLDTQFSSCYKSSSFSAQGKKNSFFIKMFDKIYK